MESAAGALDEKYRTILLLYYLEGFNTRQISEILEMKESTVKSRLQEEGKKLQKFTAADTGRVKHEIE